MRRAAACLREAPLLAAVVLPAWIALALLGTGALVPSLCVSSPQALAAVTAALHAGALSGLLLQEAVAIGIMLLAMMAPLVLGAAVHVRSSQFVERRLRATTLFLLVYASLWFAAAFALLAAAVPLRISLGNDIHLAAAGAFLCCAAWQLSSQKAAMIRSCHRKPALSPWDRTSDRDAATFGMFHGGACLATCAPGMFAALLSAHHAGAALLLTAIALAERAARDPRAPRLAAVLAGAGGLEVAVWWAG